MKVKQLMYVVAIALIFVQGVNAADIQVQAGADQISAALAGAADGDVLILATDGGEYTESATLTIEIDISIKAADGLATMPVWKTAGETFIILKHNLSLAGIDFDGQNTTGKGIFNDPGLNADGTFAFNNLIINNCIFHDFDGTNTSRGESRIIHVDDGETGFQLLHIENSVFKNVMPADNNGYGIWVERDGGVPANPGALAVEIANCTFTNISARALRLEGFVADSAGTKSTLLLDHVTIANMAGQPMRIDNMAGTISNSIIANSPDEEGIRADAGTQLVVSYSDFFNLTANFDIRGAAAITEDGNLAVDPLFTDGANGDFTLTAGSPVLTAASDGKAMGDLRWDPSSTAVEQLETGFNPDQFRLEANYPNPFNPETSIQFHLSKRSMVRITIYNLAGQKVATLTDGSRNAGSFETKWNGRYADGTEAAAGLYLYRMEADGFSQTCKMMLVK